MKNYKVSIFTGNYTKLGYETAQTIYMFDQETKEAQSAARAFEKYREQVLIPVDKSNYRSMMKYECAKAFILGGQEFFDKVTNNLKINDKNMSSVK
tara:strand:+ start:23 stop:310 length:288 start_codon:yes stop_codon:yes gene_type:complete